MKRFFNTKWQLKTLLPLPSLLPLLLIGSGFIAPIPPAKAQRLPEPRIFGDELPPPSSPSSIPTLNFPAPSSLPPASPNLPPPRREFDFQAPPPRTTPSPSANLYRVDIYGDSPLLLWQVQQIEPEAFVRSGEGVIQAGVFADRYNAQSRVRALEAQGIRARVTAIAAGVGTEQLASGQFASDRETRSQNPGLERAYFVIIPGDPSRLPDIASQVAQLGIGRNAISQRESPRGPHVAVGPFNGRGEADRWSSYFRSIGLDARVYFGS